MATMPFKRVVTQILQQHNPKLQIISEALDALQEMVKEYMQNDLP